MNMNMNFSTISICIHAWRQWLKWPPAVNEKCSFMHKMCQIPHPHRRLRDTPSPAWPGHFNHCSLHGVFNRSVNRKVGLTGDGLREFFCYKFYITLRVLHVGLKLSSYPRIAPGGKKDPRAQLSFWVSKNFCSTLGAALSWLFLNMKCVQNATIRSPIGAPEVIWHDVKHVWFFLNWRNFMVILTNMTTVPK